MLRVIILFLGLVVVVPTALGNGELGVAGLAVVIVVALLFIGSVERRDARAWNNRQEYWAHGGPERRRTRRGR